MRESGSCDELEAASRPPGTQVADSGRLALGCAALLGGVAAPPPLPDATMSSELGDIAFVFPPAHGNLGSFRSHLGVAYLRAALAKNGFSTVQYLNLNPRTAAEVAEDVLRDRKSVV